MPWVPWCLQLLLGPPYETCKVWVGGGCRSGRGRGASWYSFSGIYMCVRLCVCECLTSHGACSISEPGIYTALVGGCSLSRAKE